MRRLAPHTFAELYYVGCNPGFLQTSDGVVLIDTPQQGIDALRYKERVVEGGPIRYLVNTEPHGDHTWGNAFFPEAEVVGQTQTAAEFGVAWEGFGGPEGRLARTKAVDDSWLGDPDSVWLLEQHDFAPHPPTTLFDDELRLSVGGHEVHCLHTPGHTAGQTTVHLPGEGVVFTGDNVFHRCRTWLHDADPWAWLASLERIRALDADVIVPGHGEPCSPSYLSEQAEVLEAWIATVEGFVDRGLTEDEVLAEPLDVRARIDPHPMAQRLYDLEVSSTRAGVQNLYRRAADRARN